MKLLAIDASTELASVALMVEDTFFTEEQGSQRTHAQLLLPMINRLLAQAKCTVADLDGIVFGCGPGSFTGLRIACSIAKGLAYPHNIPLIPVSCLSTIASLAREQTNHTAILAVIDARMQEMYWSYAASNQPCTEEQVSPVETIILPEKAEVVLAGVGIELYWDAFPAALKAQICTRLTVYPNAAAMIRFACKAGIKPVPAAQAQPVYVRNQVTQGDTRG